MLYLYVAVGGALGSLCRYMMIGWLNGLWGKAFPWSTLTVNILGSFLMGLLLGVVSTLMPRGREFFTLCGIGVLGGFTTFSTFSYDAYMLIEKEDYIGAAIYCGGSVVLSIAAFFCGLWVFKIVTQ